MSSVQLVLATRHPETQEDLQSHVNVPGQNFWKEEEEISAKPHDPWHGHLRLAHLSPPCVPPSAPQLSPSLLLRNPNAVQHSPPVAPPAWEPHTPAKLVVVPAAAQLS